MILEEYEIGNEPTSIPKGPNLMFPFKIGQRMQPLTTHHRQRANHEAGATSGSSAPVSDMYICILLQISKLAQAMRAGTHDLQSASVFWLLFP